MDYGPTLASERLAEKPYGLRVNRETLRRWLVNEGLWERVRKREVVRRRRPRRACRGEMLQVDGSIHDWLEDRGPRCTLLAMIDDASSRLHARFYGPTKGDTQNIPTSPPLESSPQTNDDRPTGTSR